MHACMDTSRCLFSGVAASWTRVAGRYVRVGSQVQRSVSSSWEDERKRKPPFLKDTPPTLGRSGVRTASRHLPAPASRLGEGGQDMLSSFAAFPLPIVSTESHSPTAIQHIFLFLFFSGYCRFFLFPPPPWPLLTASTLFFVHCCCKRCNEIATKILDE